MKKMLKRLRITAVVAIAAVMTMCYTMPAFAATAPDNGIATPYSNSYPYSSTKMLVTSTSWKTIASSTTGFNCNVYIKCKNTSLSGWTVVPCDIRMLGKNGNALWEEKGAIAGLGDRVFSCGSDVYTIQIKTQAGSGTAYAYQTTQAAD
ncbi:MAG: hypothetical protein HFJ38_07570 [Bacilli bacterium]|nr:hypothetical protein [Bacilli bacterium]